MISSIQLNVVGHINQYEIYSDVKKYSAKEYDQIKIIRPSHPIIYLNCDQFRADIHSLCPLKEKIKKISYLENVINNFYLMNKM